MLVFILYGFCPEKYYLAFPTCRVAKKKKKTAPPEQWIVSKQKLFLSSQQQPEVGHTNRIAAWGGPLTAYNVIDFCINERANGWASSIFISADKTAFSFGILELLLARYLLLLNLQQIKLSALAIFPPITIWPCISCFWHVDNTNFVHIIPSIFLNITAIIFLKIKQAALTKTPFKCQHWGAESHN